MPYVVVRTRTAGVHAGTLVSVDGQTVVLTNSRRIWKWAGALTLSELATIGPKAPEDCKFAVPVNITLLDAIEVITTTPCAEAAIKAVPEWE